MAGRRSRKNKENPHYGFLVSWQPSQARVKGESKTSGVVPNLKVRPVKRAEILAQETTNRLVKKGIIKSLILVSLTLILELVVYLAWNRFIIK